MKKNYTLLSGLVLASFIGFAQNGVTNANIPAQEESELSSAPTSVDPDFLKSLPNKNSKAFLDVIYSEDFASGTLTTAPTGWTIGNNQPNNFQWAWNTVYQNGQFSNATDVITSTTAANGFMVLTGDFFNTPIPGTGAVAMDTYFESPTITPSSTRPAIWASWEQAMRYCCSGANRLVIQVSTDNFVSFTEYDASNGIAVNAASGTYRNYVNISSAFYDASVSTSSITPAPFKVRFLSEGNSHYYWMIDDFQILEGAENDMQMDDPYLEFNFDYAYNPFYNRVPYSAFSGLYFSGQLRNNGSNPATNVLLNADVSHQAYPGGAPGLGLVYSSSSAPQTIPSGALNGDTSIYTFTPDTTGTPNTFIPTVLGDFSADLSLSTDSSDQWNTIIGIDTYSQTFSTTETEMARDDNGIGGATGPSTYVRSGLTGGQVPGDAFGTMYIVEPSNAQGTQLQHVPTSITYFVSTDADQVGVEILPMIWEYDEDSLFTNPGGIAEAFGNVVATDFLPYTITTADIGDSITLSLTTGSAVTSGLGDGQYVVGWVTTNTPPNGETFEVQADASSGQFQDPVTCFIDLAHDPGWGWVSSNPAVRLNMANLPLPTGIGNTSSSDVSFDVTPNPNNGEFQLKISSTEIMNYDLNVRNVLGQVVYTDNISVNGTLIEQIDLTQFEKGVYFVSLENGAERILKKVVVQ